MQLLPAKDSSRTDFSKLYCIESSSVTASAKVLLYCEINKKAMNKECTTWLRIVSVIQDNRKIVNLSYQAKENEWT